MKYLIVGLGNIGSEYTNTRHNIGFKVVDFIAAEAGVSFMSARYGDIAEMRHRGHQVVLLKPSTYMNLSGKAVRYWMQQEKVDIANVLIVVDDIALSFGELRMRGKGSAGGHNGLKNITELLGSENFARLRFGVGGNFSKGHQVDYVLGEWTDEEKAKMDERLAVFQQAVLAFISLGVDRAMSNYNNK